MNAIKLSFILEFTPLYLFVIKCKLRDKLKYYLKKNNIQTMIHYPIAPHKQMAFKEFNKLKFQTTEKLCDQVLSLPIFPTLKKEEMEHVVKIINNF